MRFALGGPTNMTGPSTWVSPQGVSASMRPRLRIRPPQPHKGSARLGSRHPAHHELPVSPHAIQREETAKWSTQLNPGITAPSSSCAAKARLLEPFQELTTATVGGRGDRSRAAGGFWIVISFRLPATATSQTAPVLIDPRRSCLKTTPRWPARSRDASVMRTT